MIFRCPFFVREWPCKCPKSLDASSAPDLAVGAQLAFLTLCDLALNPPFLGGKMIELGKFCFIKTKFEPNLSCFSK